MLCVCTPAAHSKRVRAASVTGVEGRLFHEPGPISPLNTSQSHSHSFLATSTLTAEAKMGIPHLKSYLQPYAENGIIKPCSVTIDGPAFAYHIYGLCTRELGSSPFEQPSYKLLGETAIAWLEQIANYGFSMYVRSGPRLGLIADHTILARVSTLTAFCLALKGLNA